MSDGSDKAAVHDARRGSGDGRGGVRPDVVVIGASAGGVEALTRIAGGLPASLPAAVFVVLHVRPHTRSILPELLTHAGPLPAAHAEDGELIRRGRIYVAPPDRHLVLRRGKVHLSAGPRENHSRPAVDPLFRSAASAYGPRVVGVILSGGLSDGTAGLWEIKERGGTAVVQDPGDALYPSMPHSAMDHVPVDYVLPAAQIAGLLTQLVQAIPPQEHAAAASDAPDETPAEGVQAMATAQQEHDIPGEKSGSGDEKPGSPEVDRDTAAQVEGQRNKNVTVFICPECGGTLWQVNAGPVLRFRCHVGHVYSGDELLEGYTEGTERTLWYAVRTLRDKANLTRQLSRSARERGAAQTAARYEEKARSDEERSAVIERIIRLQTSVGHRE